MKRQLYLNNPYVLMAMVLIIWGSLSSANKLMMIKIDSYQILFYSFGIAFAALTIINIVNRKIKSVFELRGRDIALLTLYSIPLFLYNILSTLSVSKIPAMEVSMLSNLNPLMIVLFAVLINKEKINAVKIISILIGMMGVVIIITNGRFISINLTNLAGDLLIIASTIAWALFSSLGKKCRIDISVANYVYIFISFLLSGISMFIFSGFVMPGISVIGGLFWIGLFEFVFSYYLWLRALKVASSALIASISFISPFITILFIMLLVGERIAWVQIEGLIVILLGVTVQKLFPSGFRTGWKMMTSYSKGKDCKIL